jgi:lysozyme
MIDAVVDISHHNGGALNFGAAHAAGILGVIQKATQGQVYADPSLAGHKAAIKAAGLLYGTYHFGDGSDGGAQAAHYLNVANPASGELVALDFEQNPSGPTMTLEEARVFVTTVQNKIGKWPVLYAGHYLKEQLGHATDPILTNCPLWIAQYGPHAVLPSGWTTWALWQFTDGMVPTPLNVPGIGHCDCNRFDGTPANLAAFWASVSPP